MRKLSNSVYVKRFQLQNRRKAVDVKESGAAARSNPDISRYIAQRDTAGLSESLAAQMLISITVLFIFASA